MSEESIFNLIVLDCLLISFKFFAIVVGSPKIYDSVLACLSQINFFFHCEIKQEAKEKEKQLQQEKLQKEKEEKEKLKEIEKQKKEEEKKRKEEEKQQKEEEKKKKQAAQE